MLVGQSVGRYVCRVQKCVGGITWPKRAHAQSQIWVVKNDLWHPYYSFRLYDKKDNQKITRGKEMVVGNRRPRETAPGHSQKIEAKCCRKLRLEKVVTNKHLRLAVET